MVARLNTSHLTGPNALNEECVHSPYGSLDFGAALQGDIACTEITKQLKSA